MRGDDEAMSLSRQLCMKSFSAPSGILECVNHCVQKGFVIMELQAAAEELIQC